MHTCLVCGYDGLQKPLYDTDGYPTFELCDCCGFESGYDDDDQGYSIDSYREKWLLSGANWFFDKTRPSVWTKDIKIKQLKNIGVELDINKYKL